MRILLTGASGQLGSYLLRELVRQGQEIVAWSGSRSGELFGVPLQPVDLADADQVAAAFRQARPTTVLHAGAVAAVAACHLDPPRAQRINTQPTAQLTELAAQTGARLVFISTDLVFDGERGWYEEHDQPAPLSIYGSTKAAAEQAVLPAAHGLVVRVSLLFGPTLTGRPAFFDEQLAALRARRPVTLFADEWRTPLSLATAARALVALAESECGEILHLGGPERLSRLEMGQRLAARLKLDPSGIKAATRSQVAAAEPRPRDVSLNSARWRRQFPSLPWPSWDEALAEMGMAADL